MAIATNDILQAISYFQQASIQALMVSYWQVVSYDIPSLDGDFAQAFQRGLMNIGQVEAVMINSAAAVRTVINNLSTPLEYGEYVGDDAGAMSGEAAPSFVALSVKQIVPTRLTRAGYKRIPFVGESLSTGNTANVSAPTRVALEEFFGAPTEFTYMDIGEAGISFALRPLVIGRTLVGTVYELDMNKIQNVSSASVQDMTSQVSRKT